MNKVSSSLLKRFSLLICAAVAVLLGSSHLRAQGASALPSEDGKDLLAVACTQCHNLKPILMLRDGAAGWKATVNDMILRGAQLSPAEADIVIKYLIKNFGPKSGPGSARDTTQLAPPGRTSPLPAGAGKELVESRCTVCHDLEKITGEKRSRQEWESTVKNMIDRGPAATPEEIKTITSYLTAQFGKKTE